ncbi:MAG: hypothetical protein Kow00108_25280 [Calditrichia bacterium]
MKQLLIITIWITSALTFFTCKKESNPLYLTESAQLSLQVDGEPYCTEVYLQLKAEGIKFPGRIQLVRDSVMIFTHQFAKEETLLDTLLLDSALLPGRSYRYEARLLLPEGDEVQSRELSVRTMDTTSHDFTWEIFEFGGGSGSSDLYDVAIIDENNIWAVGEIHTPETDRWNEDSTEWISPYNAVHWDGEKWELLHLATNQCGGVKYPPIRTVFAFSENDILFGHTDGSITRYDGINFRNDCSLIYQLNGSVRKIWGISSSDFYVVSGNGFIAHYNGSRWEKIESGTDLPIRDIWGSYNAETEEWEILCIASAYNEVKDPRILKIKNNVAENIVAEGLPWSLKGIWFIPEQIYYLCGDGLFSVNDLSLQWEKENSLPGIYKNYIRGNGINDIVLCGYFGLISHYNGISWNSNIIDYSADFFKIQILGNLYVGVGINGKNAVLAIGRRMN